MGFATTDLDNFKILEDIPSFPVAFFCHIISTIDVKINKIGKYTENREIW
jgi:hypothetical protein